MKRVLSTTTQSSSTSALYRQQIVILLLMTCFALALTAPTTPPLPPTASFVHSESTKDLGSEVVFVTSTSWLKSEPITTQNPGKLNENNKLLLPESTTLSSVNLDTITNEKDDDEMTKTRLFVTTTAFENLIGTKSQSEVDSTTKTTTTTLDDDDVVAGTIKNHETHESAESTQQGSTMKSDLSDVSQMNGPPSVTPIETNENNKNKSINLDVKERQNEMSFDVSSMVPDFASMDAQSVATTIEMPIKLDADNSKVMENERDFQTSTSGPQHVGNVESKKVKLKESKKMALKAQKGNDKKQKLKQKLFSDINHVANVPANEPTAQPSTDKASEVYQTTHVATISTSIKTAPTTIKSTTLTTIKSSQLDQDTTMPFTNEHSSTESAMNFNEMLLETTSEPAATTNEQYRHSGDNVIVLNTNSSGLIVVDIMANFGTENASNTETFEIKMDLIDDATTTEESYRSQQPSDRARVVDEMQKIFESNVKDDIFLTTIESTASSSSDTNNGRKSLKIDSTTTSSDDDIILIDENNESTTTQSSTRIKWNEVKNGESNGNIKITFDNIDLPNQNVNVSIENGELVIDSIDISVLNKAEEELKRRKMLDVPHNGKDKKSNKTDSLEIILIEDDSHQDEKDINRDNSSENDESNLTTAPASSLDKIVNNDGNKEAEGINESNGEEFKATTIQFELPTPKHDRLKKIELSGSDEEDGIKIKTTDKDSDTVFYISNTEVKVIESIPTTAPNSSQERKYYPAIYEEDVIVDVPNKSRTSGASNSNYRYEEDIVLSPLTSDFDPKDINYIGEAFLDVEESQSGVGLSEGHHIIPLTSDVVIQPIQLRDMPSVGIPIIGALPPQIELEEMVFSDDYDNKQQPSNFHVEEYYPNFLSNRLVKNQLEADVPKELIFDSKNGSSFFPNRTHISINTMINGTNMTTASSTFPNATAFSLVESEENENADLNDIQTLLIACFATLMPLFLCVIIVLTIRYCWRKHRRQSSSGNDMTSDKSTDPLAEKNIASSADELKSTESGMTLDRGGNMQASTELLLTANGDITPTNHTGTNGSIITMTLKNNHLIVETEERNDISRDTRETKMHYSPSEKDGVFIVEAARGADQNGSHKPSPMQHKPTEAPLVIPEEIKIDTLQSHFSPSSPEEEHKQPKPEQVEVHTPPVELKEEPKKEGEAVVCNGAKTGLSQSDLSLTSSNSSNQNYTYGDKDAYQFEDKGYKGSSPKRIINVHCHDLKPLIENSPPAPIGDHNKPVITSAIFKNDSHEDGEPLKSDALAKEQNGIIPPTNGEDLDKAKIPHKLNGIITNMKNGLDEIISVPDENCNDLPFTKIDCNGEHNLDSLSFLPAPPEELSNDQLLNLTSMDSLPPPPPEMTELAQS